MNHPILYITSAIVSEHCSIYPTRNEIATENKYIVDTNIDSLLVKRYILLSSLEPVAIPASGVR